MEIPIIEPIVVCSPTSEPASEETSAVPTAPEQANKQVRPAVAKVGRPKQHANATERKRAQRAREKAGQEDLSAPIKAPKKKAHGSDATRARAYRIKKAIAGHRQYRPKVEPPDPNSGTASDWNRYLESVGLGLKAGEAESVPTNYKGGLLDLQDIDTAHQIETQTEGYLARRTPSSGNISGEDD